jgi:hypothetical protein
MKANPTFPLLSTLLKGALIIAAFLTALPAVNAQLPIKQETAISTPAPGVPIKDIKMTRFTARALEGVVYLNWYMKGEAGSSIFLVERSVNGSDFVSIGFKDGYSAPDQSTELLYSFSDNQPVIGTTHYRIKQFRTEGILYGEQVCVIIEEPLPIVESTK